MTITAFVPALVLLAGALLYLLARDGAAKPAAAELGRLAFACGLLVLLLLFAGRTITLGH